MFHKSAEAIALSSYLDEIKVKLYLCEFSFLFLKQEVCSFLRNRKGNEETIIKFKEQKVIILLRFSIPCEL